MLGISEFNESEQEEGNPYPIQQRPVTWKSLDFSVCPRNLKAGIREEFNTRK